MPLPDTCLAGALGRLSARARAAPSYVSRVLRLTRLAPDIVEAILDGRQPAEMQLDDLLAVFPLGWDKQEMVFRERNSER